MGWAGRHFCSRLQRVVWGRARHSSHARYKFMPPHTSDDKNNEALVHSVQPHYITSLSHGVSVCIWEGISRHSFIIHWWGRTKPNHIHHRAPCFRIATAHRHPHRAMSAAVGPQTFLQGSDLNVGNLRMLMRFLSVACCGHRHFRGATAWSGPQVCLTKLSRPCNQNGWARAFVWPDRRGPQVKQVWVRERAAPRQEA
jgi:hypothetical protein